MEKLEQKIRTEKSETEVFGSGEAAPEFRGESRATEAEELRKLINFEAMAEARDPEGLLEATREDMLVSKRQEERIETLEQKRGELAGLSEEAKGIYGEIEGIEGAITKRKGKFFVRVKRFFGIGDRKLKGLETKLGDKQSEEALNSEEYVRVATDISVLEKQIENYEPGTNRQEFIDSFAAEALSVEEKEKYLTFPVLSELSTEEYMKLWKRLNPFFVTHVTRQGIRDHNGMIYHSAGMGEMHNGLLEVLKDGKKLKTPARVRFSLGQDFSREDVERSLEKMDAFRMQDEEGWDARTIVPILPVNASIASAEPWSDKHAVHFAQHTVLDDYYGGEEGNEVFFVFPTDVVASQCLFGGHMHGDLVTAQVESERKWNDMFVWPEGGEIPVDAGLTFLPKSQTVNPENGSKYVVGEDGELKPVKEGVTAEEYWEGFFEANPDLRPAHVVYYDGDPSEAVKKFLEGEGVLEEVDSYAARRSRDFEQQMTGSGDSSERDGKMLGFEKHYVPDSDVDERTQRGHEEFNRLAREILEERAKKKKK